MPYNDPERKKALDRARVKLRRVTHRDELNARQRELYAENLEERRAYGKAWYAEHRLKKLAQKKAARVNRPSEAVTREKAKRKAYRATYQEHPAIKSRRQEWLSAYKKNHPEKSLEQYHRRRARKLAAHSEPVDFMQILRDSKGLCGICKKPFDLFGIDFDHIVPLSKGGSHTRDNIQATHASCNRAKGAKVGYIQ